MAGLDRKLIILLSLCWDNRKKRFWRLHILIKISHSSQPQIQWQRFAQSFNPGGRTTMTTQTKPSVTSGIYRKPKSAVGCQVRQFALKWNSYPNPSHQCPKNIVLGYFRYIFSANLFQITKSKWIFGIYHIVLSGLKKWRQQVSFVSRSHTILLSRKSFLINFLTCKIKLII